MYDSLTMQKWNCLKNISQNRNYLFLLESLLFSDEFKQGLPRAVLHH